MAAASAPLPVILGLGNPLLDLSVEVPDKALLAKYGLALNNAILAAPEHQPLYAEIVGSFGASVQYIAGGATQNSVRVAQWVSGQPAGYAAYVGAVGADEFGAKLRKAARDDGVSTLYQTTTEKPTGTCAVVVFEQERSLVANLAAAETLTEAHLDSPDVSAAVAAARVVYCAGFPLTHAGGAASVLRLGKTCAETGKLFATNLSAPFIVQFFKETLDKVLPFADFVFGNESEAEAFANANGMAGASLDAVALKIASLPKASGTRARVAVITQGPKPTIVAEGGAVRHIAVAPVDEIVDVNGAGDAFVGGFLALLAKGKSVDEAVAAGQWAAAHVIQRSGCTFDASVKYPGAQ